MKKIMMIVAASLMFAACGGSADQATATDSTSADSTVVDTTAQAIDTIVAK